KRPPSWFPNFVGSSRNSLIVATVVASIGIALIGQVLGVLESYVNTKLENRVALDFRSDLFEHCQSLSQAYHDETGTGMFMYQINFEAHNAGRITVSFPPLIQSVLTI